MLVVTFRNLSDMAPVSDYEYEVWVTTTDGHKKVLEAGTITGHTRADGWRVLLQRLAWWDEREGQP